MAKHGSPRSSIKKPVGDQRICTEQEFKHIDPVWIFGRVPNHYWEDSKNRRKYLIWLSYKLGCRKMRDIYRLTHEDIKHNHGGGLAGNNWRASLIVGVKECFPQYDWKEWLFQMAPIKFWKDRKNHIRYMRWLGEQLKIKRPEDWYRVTTEDFQRHAGGSFLLCYRSSVSLVVKKCMPRHDWKDWMFYRTPVGFWDSRANRRRYMRWLGKVLKIKHLDDWYRISYKDFINNHGGEFIKKYHQTPALAVMDLIPRRNWYEWRFNRVPPGFWKKAENRRRYMHWLGKKLKFRRPEEWFQVRWKHFQENCAGSLMLEFRSCTHLLREYLPQLDWYYWNKTCRISEKQIIQWAKDYFARHRKWPTRKTTDGIPGTRKTWQTIQYNLKCGGSGLRKGKTLTELISGISRKSGIA
jgi:hypothetical protein